MQTHSRLHIWKLLGPNFVAIPWRVLLPGVVEFATFSLISTSAYTTGLGFDGTPLTDDNVSELCCSRAGCDSVTWRCLHRLSLLPNNREVQWYNTRTTDRHLRQGLEFPRRHRRLWANVSAVFHWIGEVCLASVGRWHWHTALVVKVFNWHDQPI